MATTSEHEQSGVYGTVSRVTSKGTGERTVHIVCDDGTPVSVIVMPTIDATIPSRGTRVSVTGRVLDTGVLILDKYDGIQVTDARPQDDIVQVVRLSNRRLASTGAHLFSMTDTSGHFVGPAVVVKEVSMIGHKPEMVVVVRGHESSDGTFIIEHWQRSQQD